MNLFFYSFTDALSGINRCVLISPQENQTSIRDAKSYRKSDPSQNVLVVLNPFILHFL